jgi:hypothetical protein
MLDYLINTLRWQIDTVATNRLISLSPSRDETLCWFLVWMPRDAYSTLQFSRGVFDLQACPIGQEGLALNNPRALHAEEDLNWGSTGFDVDALVEEIDGQWWNPDCDDELEFTRRLYNISHAYKAALNLNFTPCARRRFKPNDGHTWIVVLMARTQLQAEAIRARSSDVQRRSGRPSITWNFPEIGVFQLVKFDRAKLHWSKLKMDTATARAASDQATLGRRLYIGDLHEGVLPADLDAAITDMGYEIESPTETVTRHWGTVGYITLATNDQAVDLILRSDSLQVGDPPCRLRIKIAKPRDPPRKHHPTEEASALGDQQDSEAHGDSHGMTDKQVTKVVDAIQTVQESALSATITRLTGAVTGLPPGFQLALDTRLTRIEDAIILSHRETTLQLASVQSTVETNAQLQQSQIHNMTRMIEDLVGQVGRLTQAQEAWSEEYPYQPDPNVVQGSDLAAPTTFADRLDAVAQHHTPAAQQRGVDPTTPTTEPRANGGADMSMVRTPSEPQLAPQPKNAPTLTLTTPIIPVPAESQNGADIATDEEQLDPAKRKAPEDSPQDTIGKRRGRLGKLKKASSSESEGDETTDKHPVDTHDLDALYDSSQQDTQPPSTPSLEHLSTANAALNPHRELAPGYTVITCDALITAWNAISGPASVIGIGDNAAQLLSNAEMAERLLNQIAHSPTLNEAHGCDPLEARAALDRINASREHQQARANANPDTDQQGADTEL